MSTKNLYRKRIWTLLEPANENDKLSKIVDIFLVSLIFFNILSVILETVDVLYLSYKNYFRYFEYFSVIIFSLEYISRLWACIENKKSDETNLKARFRYVFSFSAIVDAIAILPSLLAFIFPTVDLRFVRALRIFRLLKFSRYSNSINNLLLVLWDQRKSFGAAFFILFIVLIISSSGMYLVEKDVQPEKFGSIPQAMWWSIVTLTTVGYGDVSPVTPLGKVIGAFTAIMGVCTVALLTGIVATSFSNQRTRKTALFEAEINDALKDGFISDDEAKKIEELRKQLNLSEEHSKSLIDLLSDKNKK